MAIVLSAPEKTARLQPRDTPMNDAKPLFMTDAQLKNELAKCESVIDQLQQMRQRETDLLARQRTLLALFYVAHQAQ